MNEIIHKIKGYLGYGVFIANISNPNSIHIILDNFVNDLGLGQVEQDLYFGYIKLKLRTLKSLTDEEIEYIAYNEGLLSMFSDAKYRMRENTIGYIKLYLMEDKLTIGIIEYFHKNHIDYQDLIDQGLAVELTNKGE